MPTELPTSPVSETDEVETARGPRCPQPGGGCEVLLKHACRFDLVRVRFDLGKCFVLKDTSRGINQFNLQQKGFFSRLHMNISYRIPPFHCAITEVT